MLGKKESFWQRKLSHIVVMLLKKIKDTTVLKEMDYWQKRGSVDISDTDY